MRIFCFAMLLLFQDLCDHTGANGQATFADGKLRPLLQRHRHDQLHFQVYIVARHHHLDPFRQLDRPRHVHRSDVNCGRYPLKNALCRPPSSRLSTYTSLINLVCGVMLPGFATTIPRSTCSRSIPRSSRPRLSPACPWSSNLWNISTPVTTELMLFSCNPTISTGSPTLITPRSTRPVTTVPRPLIENTSSIGIMNGFSTSRTGSGMYSSTTLSNSRMLAYSAAFGSVDLLSNASNALPLTIGVSSPGKPYSFNNSRNSNSTNSNNSGSSIMSTLFRYTTIAGTSTCRASSTCSRVCGIAPSGAATTRIAPSTCAAPVIMFLM